MLKLFSHKNRNFSKKCIETLELLAITLADFEDLKSLSMSKNFKMNKRG